MNLPGVGRLHMRSVLKLFVDWFFSLNPVLLNDSVSVTKISYHRMNPKILVSCESGM